MLVWFDVWLVVGWIGVEICGVILFGELDVVIVEVIQVVLVCYKVIFFWDQSYFDDQIQEVFVYLFGELVVYFIVLFCEGICFFFELDGVEGCWVNFWYIDVIFVEVYLKVLILCSVVVLEFGGDIVWVNMVSVYVDLLVELCELVDWFWVVYSNEYDYVGVKFSVLVEQLENYCKVFILIVYEIEYLVVCVYL